MSGEQKLTDAQIETLYNISAERAYNQIKKEVPNIVELPEKAQAVLTEMAFQLGSLSNWTNLKRAVAAKDWNKAADEILLNKEGTGPSELAAKIPNRAKYYADTLRSLAEQPQPNTQPPYKPGTPTLNSEKKKQPIKPVVKASQPIKSTVNPKAKVTEKSSNIQNNIETVNKALQNVYYELTDPKNKDNKEIKDKYDKLINYRNSLITKINKLYKKEAGIIDATLNEILPTNGIISITALNKFGLTDEVQQKEYTLPKFESYEERKAKKDEKYRTSKRYEDLNPNSKSPYLAYRYSASNNNPIKVNPYGTRGDRRGTDFKGKGTLMHFLDENPITGFRHGNTQNMIKGLNKNDYIGIIENKEKGSYIKYITKEEYEKNPKQGKSFLVRQVKFDDINFDKKIEDTNFKGHTYWTNKKGTIFPLSIGKDETIYDKTSGQSVVFIFKYKGDTRYVHFANSPAEIKKEGQRIKNEYNLKDGDLTIGLGDAGSFSASLRGKNNKVTHSDLMKHFYNTSGATGAGVTFE